jgi:hypothetical protein
MIIRGVLHRRRELVFSAEASMASSTIPNASIVWYRLDETANRRVPGPSIATPAGSDGG